MTLGRNQLTSCTRCLVYIQFGRRLRTAAAQVLSEFVIGYEHACWRVAVFISCDVSNTPAGLTSQRLASARDQGPGRLHSTLHIQLKMSLLRRAARLMFIARQ